MIPKPQRSRVFAMLLLAALAAPVAIHAQQQPAPQDNPTPEAGGPAGDTGAIALPHKSTAEAPPPPSAPRVENPAGMGDVSIRVDVPLVTVPVGVVTEKNRQFIPNLQQENFRVFEDGVEQKITGFQQARQPVTAVLLLEFASTNAGFIYDMRAAAASFARQLQPEDSTAVVTYDLRTHIVTDFTSDRRRVYDALNTLTVPMFSDRNMFDALYETLDRLSVMDTKDGRKYIVLIGSGRDTFSKITLDKILKKIKDTPNVTIFTVSTGQQTRERAFGSMSSSRSMDYLQADNEMQTFARMTGGQWYNPMFQGALPDIFRDINASIRSAYVLSYSPTNARLDGTYRKLRVEVVDKDGKPLRVEDEKHKPQKYEVVAREGYKAKQTVE